MAQKGNGLLAALAAGLVAAAPSILKSCAHSDFVERSIVTAAHDAPARREFVRDTIEASAQRNAHDLDLPSGEAPGASGTEALGNGAPLGGNDGGEANEAINRAVVASAHATQTDDPWRPLPKETLKIASFKGISPPITPTVRKPRLLAAFPSNDVQFRNVYGHSPSAAMQSEMRALIEKAQSMPANGNYVFFPETTTLRDSLEDLREGDLVVIIAHSEGKDGASLRFPNGVVTNYSDVHRTCGEVGVRCVIVTCYSRDLGLETAITTADAIAMWSYAATQALKAHGNMRPSEFILSLRLARENLERRRAIVISALAKAGAIGSVGGGYELVRSYQR